MKAIMGKNEIIKCLKEKILSMEGFCGGEDTRQYDFGLEAMSASFPRGIFPVGTIHEFISPDEACMAATNGFLSGLLGTLMKKDGTCLWVSVGRRLFPPVLKLFGIEPHRVIFIDVGREQDALWVMEQGLKCRALAAVVAELQDLSFAESRRLQLAVESSRITGFLHRCRPQTENTLACVSRWKIRPIASYSHDGLPGVGFPRMEVELAKIRNGKPGIWQFEWRNGVFKHIATPQSVFPRSIQSKKGKRYA